MVSDCYGARMSEALAYVAERFQRIRRKGSGVPYLSHLLAVAGLVADHRGDEEQIIAALLHDVLEDIDGVTPSELETRFGGRVARLVVGLSDTTSRPKPPWTARKQAYLARLRGEPADLKLICAADKLHNATTLLRDYGVEGDALWRRFTPTREQTLWYYRAIVASLRDGFSHPILDELEAVVLALHERVGVEPPLVDEL
ncbi:MAG: HD domain-containing protein [Polyangiaceae bacterium]|nr:HD domain-containing protein [Polyangiaceae bacterium]